MPNEITASLPELADRINAAHVRAEGAINDALASAREAGRLLLEAKARPDIQHGEWKAWLAANFRGSYRTAAAYMRVAREWGQIAKVQTSAPLSIDAALRLIATPRDDEPEEPEPAAGGLKRVFKAPPGGAGMLSETKETPISHEMARIYMESDVLTDNLQLAGLTYPTAGRALVGYDAQRANSTTTLYIVHAERLDRDEYDGLHEGDCVHIAVAQAVVGSEHAFITKTVHPLPWWWIVEWVRHHTGEFGWRSATWADTEGEVIGDCFWPEGCYAEA